MTSRAAWRLEGGGGPITRHSIRGARINLRAELEMVRRRAVVSKAGSAMRADGGWRAFEVGGLCVANDGSHRVKTRSCPRLH